MKNSTIVKLFLLLVGVLVLLGVVLPWLISAANTLMVIAGLVIVGALILGVLLYANHLWLTRNEVNTVKKD